MKNLKGWILKVVLLGVVSCSGQSAQTLSVEHRDYRQEMRTLVREIRSFVKPLAENFIILPQNGQDLLTLNGEPDGPLAENYISAIDGLGREDLYFGYNRDNSPTPEFESKRMEAYLDRAILSGLEVLVTDYCRSPIKVRESYDKNGSRGYLSFAADSRAMDRIPTLPAEAVRSNQMDILTLSDAENFLYLINPSANSADFPDKASFLRVLEQSSYDILLIDLFFDGTMETILTAEEIKALQTKPGGGRRLVIAYMSIGEAEDYRYYWENDWNKDPPSWLAEENPHWKGNFKVLYWDPEWKSFLFGKDRSYLNLIVNAGFDGVYLDIIDAFEYFEME